MMKGSYQKYHKAIYLGLLILFANHVSAQVTPGKVVLNTPVTGQVMDHGTGVQWQFDWQDVPGATRYQILVEHANKTDRLLNTYVTESSSYTYTFTRDLDAKLTKDAWGWWVRAQIGSEWGPWSNPHTIYLKEKTAPAPPPEPTIATRRVIPILSSPPENAVLENGHNGGLNWTFTWHRVPGAARYEIKVGSVKGGQEFSEYVDASKTSYTYTTSTYVKEEFLSGWYWEVRAGFNGKWSKWSRQHKFSVKPLPPKPTDRFGSSYFRIMGGFINAYLGQEQVIYPNSREVLYGPLRLVVEHDSEEFLEFQLEYQNRDTELYAIKGYGRGSNNQREELGYLNFNLEFSRSPEMLWKIEVHPSGYFQIVTEDGRYAIEIMDANNREQKLHMQLVEKSTAQRQSFKIIRN